MGGCGRETSVATAFLRLSQERSERSRVCFQRRPFILPQAKMGLRIISYTLKEVSDANGYMDSLGVQKIEEVKKIARMGPSEPPCICSLESPKPMAAIGTRRMIYSPGSGPVSQRCTCF